MSRRKQPNPKSIKMSSDSPDCVATCNDADLTSPVAQESILSDAGESICQSETREESVSCSPHEHADSPENIDVVNMTHTSPTSSPPPTLKSPQSSTASPSFDRVTVKMEKEENEDCSPGSQSQSGPYTNGHGNPSSSNGDEAENMATQGLIRHLQLPNDVLYLKEVEVSVHGNPTPSWMICSAIPLPKGSSLGPYSGHMVSSENIRVGNLIVEFRSKTGHVVLFNVAGLSGAWLALLRPAENEMTRNTLVYLEGGRIWCEIMSDVEIGMELRATFTFDFEDLTVAERELSTAPVSPLPRAPSASASSPTSTNHNSNSPPVVQQSPGSGHAALIYGCPFCGVRFSSPRTLQGHLSYYCSKKKQDHMVSPRLRQRHSSNGQIPSVQKEMSRIKQEVDTDGSQSSHTSQHSVDTPLSAAGSKRPAAALDANSSGGESSPPPPKRPCTDNQVFRCPLCSFQADKPAGLMRHMRIHSQQFENGEDKQHSVTSRMGPAAGGPVTPSSATFCKDCNIQFSTMSTYRCHKDHYCSQRNAVRNSSDVKEEGPQFGMSGVAPLAVPSNLSAASLQLASLGQNGLIFPPGPGEGGALSSSAGMMPGAPPAMILTAPVMTATGITSMAIPLPSALVQSIQNAAAAAAAATVTAPVSPPSATSSRKSLSPKTSPLKSVPEEAHRSKSPKLTHSNETENSAKELPLDLSTKRSELEDSGHSPFLNVKKEKDDERTAKSMHPLTEVSSPAGRRSSSVEGLDRPLGTTPPSITPTTPTSVAAIPPHILNPMLPAFLPMPGMAGIPISPQSHAFGAVPPGSSKCTDCNIIFYKPENFRVHKEHYCSGKKLRPSSAAPLVSPRAYESDSIKPEASATVTSTPEPGTSQSQQGNAISTSVSSNHMPSATAVKLPLRTPLATAPGLEDVYYKFFCIPCKIKFSSASNLKAHKEYYCPHGKNSEHTIIAQTPNGEIVSTGGNERQSPCSNGSSPSPGQYCCTQCRAMFTSSRLLKLHLCSADVNQASLLKCTHCDYITHTDKRLAEHMKVHNPTSAYRCTLCGYRGNTVRGMRMHGKSHTDNGEDFTDNNMIEFQEPPLVPIQTNSDRKGAPLSVEAELLRLKNEPYKRRRSRKSYEKVDVLVPLDEPHSCQLCGECFVDSRSLAMHLRIHEIASQYMMELARCSQCDYVTKSVEDLRNHVEISHAMIAKEEKENRPESASTDRASPSDWKSFEKKSLGRKSPVCIKKEPLDSDFDHRDSSPDRGHEKENKPVDFSPRELTETDSRDSAQVKDTSETGSPQRSEHDSDEVEGSLIKKCRVQVKNEPELEKDEDSYNDPPLPITFAASPSASRIAQQSSPSSPQENMESSSHSDLKNEAHSSPANSPPTFSVKREPDFVSHSLPPPTNNHFSRSFVAPSVSQCPSGVVGSLLPDRNIFPVPSSEISSAPYCKNCDISFTYHSTFVAHKKYYCTESAGIPSSATA